VPSKKRGLLTVKWFFKATLYFHFTKNGMGSRAPLVIISAEIFCLMQGFERCFHASQYKLVHIVSFHLRCSIIHRRHQVPDPSYIPSVAHTIVPAINAAWNGRLSTGVSCGELAFGINVDYHVFQSKISNPTIAGIIVNRFQRVKLFLLIIRLRVPAANETPLIPY